MIISSKELYRRIFKSDQFPIAGSKTWRVLAQRAKLAGLHQIVYKENGTSKRGYTDKDPDQEIKLTLPQIDQELHQILELSSDEQERVEKEQIAKRAFADDATWQGLVQRNINKS